MEGHPKEGFTSQALKLQTALPPTWHSLELGLSSCRGGWEVQSVSSRAGHGFGEQPTRVCHTHVRNCRGIFWSMDRPTTSPKSWPCSNKGENILYIKRIVFRSNSLKILYFTPCLPSPDIPKPSSKDEKLHYQEKKEKYHKQSTKCQKKKKELPYKRIIQRWKKHGQRQNSLTKHNKKILRTRPSLLGRFTLEFYIFLTRQGEVLSRFCSWARFHIITLRCWCLISK